MSDRLPELIGRFRAEHGDKLGQFSSTGIVAIAVDPGPIPLKCEGIRAVFQRVATGIVDPAKVAGGTYFDDYFRLELIQFMPYGDYASNPAAANRLKELLRGISVSFRVGGTRYNPPSQAEYERSLIDLHLPSLVLQY